jgi:uncharacterized protein YndB with AHSA1/START domain
MSSTATATASVAVPVDRVWAVLSDHEGMSAWAPGLKAELTKPGETERNGVGAVRKLSTPGPAPAIVEEITAYEPDQRLAYKALAGVPLKGYRGEVQLRPSGAGTEIEYTISVEPRVPVVEPAVAKLIARSLLALLVRQVRRSAA